MKCINLETGKYRFQETIEKILRKHGVNLNAGFYLKLRNSPYMDLVLERNGATILVGHYYEQNGDLVSDPVLAFIDKEGFWQLLRIEQWCGDTTIRFWDEKGREMINLKAKKDVESFMEVFRKNIEFQDFLNATTVRR